MEEERIEESNYKSKSVDKIFDEMFHDFGLAIEPIPVETLNKLKEIRRKCCCDDTGTVAVQKAF